MASGIPDGITRADVLEAIADFEADTAHLFLDSTTYDVVVAGQRYPPKAIVGLAARRLAGRTLSPQDFRGGEGTRCFRILRDLGFEVVHKERAGTPASFTTLPTEENSSESFVEGASRLVVVNAFERDGKARTVCIANYGAICVVCGFNFSEVYGEIGLGFIHVHHLRDLATIDEEYEVDPVADLRPVCPNCHAMLHVEAPSMTIEKLRATIASARRQKGSSS